MQEIDDLTLVSRAQAGDNEAVGELYDRHRVKIFRYLRVKVGDIHVAQDLTGEVFLRMVNHLPSFKPMGVPFTAWLYRVARSMVAQHYAQMQRQDNISNAYVTPHDDSADLAEQMDQKMALESIWQGLEQLDEIQREVVTLRLVAGLSLKETAQTLDRTVASIKTLQHRGLTRLQALIAIST